mgnify:CR=1 FL=1
MKKDYDKIAALEKAISEKYGSAAAQDFRSGWTREKEEEYLNQLESANREYSTRSFHTEENGDIIIKKRNKPESTPRTCPVCKTYSFSSKDDLYMIRYKCCWVCYDDFVLGNEVKWKEGWRPDEHQLEIALRRRK